MTPGDAADFDPVAGVYAAARPSYPAAAVDVLLDGAGPDVVDVGAGTGLFTRLLRGAGRSIIAIEPSAGMLRELVAALPDVRAVQGTGERMPLPDASADVVVFAQAWHWVEPVAASAEAARVLRPGGRLGLVWNLRDEREEWVRALGTAMRADGDHFRGAVEDPVVSPPFGEPERFLAAWTRMVTADELLADVRSRSYFALLEPAAQRAVIADVESVLAARAPEDGERHALPYVTASFRYRRP
ncbi:class I SAM-dependent methyltransferase [Microbacterium sp. CJ88]|uniref:class I SAM-dependent methyltransferase n=1 Tax=Microbacterium sp. CJ88 TaxID=3445672 RepID=UPI003F65DE66